MRSTSLFYYSDIGALNTPEQAAEALELDTEYVSDIMNLIVVLHKSDEEIAMKLMSEKV